MLGGVRSYQRLAACCLVFVSVLVSGCGRQPPPPPAPSSAPPPVRPPERPPLPRRIDPLRLADDVRGLPGVEEPTTVLRYCNTTAATVRVSGAWNGWETQIDLKRRFGLWEFDITRLYLPFGRHEFKFLPDGEWEKGDNRVFFVNNSGMFESPPDLIFSARVEARNRIDVIFKRDVDPDAALAVRLEPGVPIDTVRWTKGSDQRDLLGYAIVGDHVRFLFDESLYGTAVAAASRVSVVGTFNGWRADAAAMWQLQDADDDGHWEAMVPLSMTQPHGDAQDVQFKFVVNGSRWLAPPSKVPNAVADGEGNTNLKLDTDQSKASVLQVYTAEPLELSTPYMILFDDVHERCVWTHVTPGKVFDGIRYDGPLGAILDKQNDRTTFRLFAPRASAVDLWLFNTPYLPADTNRENSGSCHPMQPMASTGTWEYHLPGLLAGQYYAFSVDGPAGPGESFSGAALIGGPRARAVAHSTNAAIVIDSDATNEWFSGWTDQDYKAPAWQDMVICETHVRHFTVDPSSGVPARTRGRYQGVLETVGLGTGLDHLKAMGVNMIEFMPISEFDNGTDEHQWGYAPAYYFAPEASFAQRPLEGSQYYEFKHLVNELHRNGVGVILDVVYNHVGHPNVFSPIDHKYYFRMDHEFELSNFSGCGNDVKTESPMMRRFIVDNVLYWMQEHHVDGFRFDLAELIDMETLMAVRDAARKVNPNVILISEPWSFRGDHKYRLTGTGWAAWNNEFRDTVRGFARGHGDLTHLEKMIAGSVDTWTANPLQTVNYIESHDDRCLTDELTFNRNHDGRRLSERDAARHRLAATLLFTSLGIPMIAEGQAFMRSKHGIHNTYDRGDAINALRWGDRDRPVAAALQSYYAGLIAMRQSARGASFRCRDKPPKGYIMWMRASTEQAMGFLINPKRQIPGAPFAVLVNAANRPIMFTIPPRYGPWRLVGNGREVDMSGVSNAGLAPVNTETGAIRVPPMTALIYCGK